MMGWPPSRLLRAIAGLALIQFALPKVLPLPGVSERWLVFFVGGGATGIIATLVGGALLLVLGAGLVPRGLDATRLAGLSAVTAILSRLPGLLLALLLGVEVHLWPGAGPGTGLVLGLAVTALVYGAAFYLVAYLMEIAGASGEPATGL